MPYYLGIHLVAYHLQHKLPLHYKPETAENLFALIVMMQVAFVLCWWFSSRGTVE